jgi:spore germination protein YaaH
MNLRSIGGKLAVILLIWACFAQPHPLSAEAQAALPFDDISHSYAIGAIVHLNGLHILNGTSPRIFEPTRAISRAEWVALLDRLLALEPVAAPVNPYRDVPKSAWYYEWVQPAVQLGIAKGTAADRFEPGRPVTRQEAAVLFARALKLSTGAPSRGDLSYLDRSAVDSWALGAVRKLQQLGLMSGDQGKFRPQDPITRQEAAALIDRVASRPDWFDQTRKEPASRIRMGWQYGQTTAQYKQQVAGSNVNTLSPRWFFLNADGGLDDGADPSLTAWAHGRGLKVWSMAGNRFDPEATHRLLAQADLRKSFIQALSDSVRRNDIDGVNLDFENIAPEDKDLLTQFVEELARQLHAQGAVLSVNVSPDFGTDWTAAFDFAALGKRADYIVLMGYDEHWDGDPQAGSVSSLPWLQQGLTALLGQVPAGQTILALPFYTRDWTESASGTASSEWTLIRQNDFVSALPLKPVWDDKLGQYTAVYWSGNVRHRIWLEDGRSLALKTLFGESRGLAGYAYWPMGGESPDIWVSLRNAIRYGSYRFDEGVPSQ